MQSLSIVKKTSNHTPVGGTSQVLALTREPDKLIGILAHSTDDEWLDPADLLHIMTVGDEAVSSIHSDGIGFLGAQIQPADVLDVLEHVWGPETNGSINQETLNALISDFSHNEFFSDENSEDLPVNLFFLSQLLLKRAGVLGSTLDTDRAIECLTKAARISQEDNISVSVLHALAKAHQKRFMRNRVIADISMAIQYQNQAINLAGNDHEDYGVFMGELGSFHWLRYEAVGELEDLDRAIEYQIRALSFISDISDDRANTFNNLGNSYMSRFKRLGGLEDISKSIDYHTQAVCLTPEEHPKRSSRLSNMGNSYLTRYEHLAELGDISKAVECHVRAVQRTPEGHLDRPSQLNNLGLSYKARFEVLGELEDLSKAIEYHSLAVHLTPKGHPDLLGRFSNLGISHLAQYERLGELEDLKKAITYQTSAVERTPERDSNRPSRFNNLGISYKSRFERLGELDDVNKAIDYLTQAVQLTPKGHPDMSGQFNNLGISYKSRFERLGQLEDINRAIDCQIQAVQRCPWGHPDRSSRLGNLGNSYMSRFQRLGKLDDISRAIECQMQAAQLIPEGHPNKPGQFNNLGNSYLCKFDRLGELVDINKAIECLVHAINLTPEGHPNNPSQSSNLGISYLCRFDRLGELEDLCKTIECQARAVALTPEGHPDIPSRFNNLGNSYLCRFQRLGDVEDLNIAIDRFKRAVSLTPHRHSNLPGMLNNLGIAYAYRVKVQGKIDDLNAGVDSSLQAANATLDSNAEKPSRLHNLGHLLITRFQLLKEPKDIENAIESYTRALQLLPQSHVQSSIIQYMLGTTYYMRLKHFRRPQDMIAALRYLEAAARSATGIPSVRFQASRDWARHLAIYNSPVTMPAHRTAMQLLPEIIWLGTTVSRRYERIIEVGAVTVEATAAAISAQKYSLALEWFAEGRYIVWNQILQLRTPCDILASVKPALAKELQQVSSDLEYASRRKPVTVSVGFNPATLEQATLQHHQLVDKYNQLVGQARNLPGFHDFMRPKQAAKLLTAASLGPVVVINIDADSCDSLILFPGSSRIAHVPLPDLSQAEVVSLHESLRESLGMAGIRNRNMRGLNEPAEIEMEKILYVLWYKLVRPILDYLGYTSNVSKLRSPSGAPQSCGGEVGGTPERSQSVERTGNTHSLLQLSGAPGESTDFAKKLPVHQLPHITWCSTGALTFLPIHAAGNYDSEGEHIFDFAVTSYTPTLTALLPAPSQPSVDTPGLLVVGQKFTTGYLNLPGVVSELASIKRHVAGLPLMILEDSQATPEAVLKSMDKYSCVHLACHATQNIEAPTESGFHLHTGILSLEVIAQQSLKNKGLAFLSACGTAAGDLKLPDEAIHLATGMLVAGYPSVIATMWSIDDRDAALLADSVYGELMKGGKLDCSQAARALHAATGALRVKVGERAFTRWAPFIHIGQ